MVSWDLAVPVTGRGGAKPGGETPAESSEAHRGGVPTKRGLSGTWSSPKLAGGAEIPGDPWRGDEAA